MCLLNLASSASNLDSVSGSRKPLTGRQSPSPVTARWPWGSKARKAALGSLWISGTFRNCRSSISVAERFFSRMNSTEEPIESQRTGQISSKVMVHVLVLFPTDFHRMI